jgi:hypothetical protein
MSDNTHVNARDASMTDQAEQDVMDVRTSVM